MKILQKILAERKLFLIMILAFFVLILTSLVLILVLSNKIPFPINGLVKTNKIQNTKYSIQEYTVKNNDSLKSIAENNGLTTQLLMAVNGLSRTDKITAGLKLKIPVMVANRPNKEGRPKTPVLNLVMNQREQIGISRFREVLGNPELKFAKLPSAAVRTGESRFQINESGFFSLMLSDKNNIQIFASIFIPPLPSKIVKQKDMVYWYVTQFPKDYNCGPAVSAMAINWSLGTNLAADEIRDEMGFADLDGSISFDDIASCFDRHGISYRLSDTARLREIVDALDSDHLVILAVKSGTIPPVEGDPRVNLIGRYYEDMGGHFIMIRGYSNDGKYFVVHDPIPSDWENDEFRHSDYISAIGENRYYSSEKIIENNTSGMFIEVLGNI